jgi:hypothetical protein
MLVIVESLWDEGRLLERGELIKRRMNCVCGEIRLERQRSDGSADRPTLVARLLNSGFDSLSPLQDAAATWIFSDHILINRHSEG